MVTALLPCRRTAAACLFLVALSFLSQSMWIVVRTTEPDEARYNIDPGEWPPEKVKKAAPASSPLRGGGGTGVVGYPTTEKEWIRTSHTHSKFVAAGGVNLALYGQQQQQNQEEIHRVEEQQQPFELFEDFNIEDQVRGDEGWWDLVRYREHLRRPSLRFYIDKVAQKRWLPSLGKDAPHVRPYVLRYASELTDTGRLEDEKEVLMKLIPKEANYAAKPTHKSCSNGVWVVKHDAGNNITYLGRGSHGFKEEKDFDRAFIADSLAKDLHEKAKKMESWALLNVRPGVLVEERYAAYGSDLRPAEEFTVFTIWGRAWIANWRWGSIRQGLVHRNGTVVEWSGKTDKYDTLPDWVKPQWPRVVEIAERLGANKDLYRTDLYVGVPAGSPSLREGASKAEQLAAVQVVVSETEIHPTTLVDDPEIFEEGARLWIAGYKMGNYQVVPNTEVPKSFLEHGSLSADSAEVLGRSDGSAVN